MEPGGSVLRSQGLSNIPYPESNQPNSSYRYLFLIRSYHLPLTDSIAYGTRRFNAEFTRALQYPLSWAESTQFLVLIPISNMLLPSTPPFYVNDTKYNS